MANLVDNINGRERNQVANFPSSLPSFTNPTGSNFLNSPAHATQHSNANDEITAIATKVGIDSSAVTTTHAYKLGGVTGTDKAASLAGTETLSGKRITKRVSTTASSATPTPNADTDDIYTVTALATGATFGAPSGTPTNGQGLIIRIKDNAGAQTLAWNVIYRAVGVTLPTTTVISKTIYVGCIYNDADSKWDVVAVQEQA